MCEKGGVGLVPRGRLRFTGLDIDREQINRRTDYDSVTGRS